MLTTAAYLRMFVLNFKWYLKNHFTPYKYNVLMKRLVENEIIYQQTLY